MPVRRTATWTSLTGDLYKVQLLDSTLAADSSDTMDLGPAGFDLSYDGKPDDILNLLIPSSVTLSILIANSTDEAIISDIASSAEGRFMLAIYKYNGSAYTLFWAGVIVSDLSDWEDADYPFLYRLKAIDGLARLKEVECSFVGGDYTFIDHLVTALKELSIASFWGSTDTFFSTAANWFSNQMFSTSPPSTLDPLDASSVAADTYTKLDNDKQRVYLNCNDVLKQILEQWNMRLFLADGRFWLLQTNMLVGATNVTVHGYDKSGTATTDETIALNISSGFDRKGSFRFLRAVSKVSLKQTYWMPFASERLANASGPYTSEDIGLFSSGNSETLNILGTVNISMSDSDSTSQKNHLHFKMKVKVGDYYLSRSGSDYQWTTTVSEIDFFSPLFLDFNYTTNVIINITTPPLEGMGLGEFSFNFYQYEDETGAAISLPSTVTCTVSYDSFSIKQSATDGSQPFSATSSYIGTLYEKKLDDLITGDGPSSDDKGKISVLNTSSAWVEARGDWTKGGSGTPTWLNQLMTEQVLSLQALPLRKYHGTIERGNIAAYNTITFNGKTYALLSGSFNANYNRWTGYWAELSEN